MSTRNQSLHQQAISLSKNYLKAERDLLSVLEQIDNAKAYVELGYQSLHNYIVEALNLSPSQAYALTTVSRKAAQVPELKSAIQAGELSIQTARRITAVITPTNGAEWIEKAKNLTQRQLEKEVVRVNPKLAAPERTKPIAENLNELRCSITDEELKLLERVRNLCSQRKQKACSTQETLSIALSEYIERHDPVKKAERLSLRTKTKVTAIPTQKKGRAPIPASIKHQVNLRDRGQCTFRNAKGKRCPETRWLEMHHIHPVALGGPNRVENLTTLCHFHHRRDHLTETER